MNMNSQSMNSSMYEEMASWGTGQLKDFFNSKKVGSFRNNLIVVGGHLFGLWLICDLAHVVETIIHLGNC